MGSHEVVIGLELHVQLSTRTKLFCGCAVDPQAPPNSLTDPVCLGLPGVLPVLNAAAVRRAVRLARALCCEVARSSRFARKHYFYPDLPKNFQITQFDRPLARGGAIEFERDGELRSVRLERLHVEEDAGRSDHESAPDRTRVDLNRAGTPLVEVVTRPELRDPTDAGAVVSALREWIRWLDVSHGNMELGQLRCDANISLRERGRETLGPKVEIKNLNSVRHVVAALEFEARRQQDLLDQGQAIKPQTRGYDPDRRETFLMREKEGAADYRYFAEPDLPTLMVEGDASDEDWGIARAPWQWRRRWTETDALDDESARVIAETRARAEFFEAVVQRGASPRRAALWIRGDLLRLARERGDDQVENLGLPPEALAALCEALDRGDWGHDLARRRVEEVVRGRRDVTELMAVSEAGIDAEELDRRVRELLRAHPEQVESYRRGKRQLLGWFLGEARREFAMEVAPEQLAAIIRRWMEEE